MFYSSLWFPGYKEDEFNWPAYLKKCKAQAAPKSLFENQNTVSFFLIFISVFTLAFV